MKGNGILKAGLGSWGSPGVAGPFAFRAAGRQLLAHRTHIKFPCLHSMRGLNKLSSLEPVSLCRSCLQCCCKDLFKVNSRSSKTTSLQSIHCSSMVSSGESLHGGRNLRASLARQSLPRWTPSCRSPGRCSPKRQLCGILWHWRCWDWVSWYARRMLRLSPDISYYSLYII